MQPPNPADKNPYPHTPKMEIYRRTVVLRRMLLFLSVALLATTNVGYAVRPAADLLPENTVGFVSIPNPDALVKGWQKTQFGQLLSHPQMRPFLTDIQRQLQSQFGEVGLPANFTLLELQNTFEGEVCLASVQPDGDATQHAIVMLADITGHREAAETLLRKVEQRLAEQGADKSMTAIQGITVSHFTLPKTEKNKHATEILFFLHNEQLVAADHAEVLEKIIGRIQGTEPKSLAQLVAYQAVQTACKSMDDQRARIRWFVDPFRYVTVIRASQGNPPIQGVDMMKVLRHQGFDAIKAIGGQLALVTEEHEVLHQTYVYAPAFEKENGEKYRAAAKLLDFPNQGELIPQAWVPGNASGYTSFSWNVQKAFYAFKPLVNEIAGDKIFDDILDGIRDDPRGPMVDIRRDVISHLGNRATSFNDNRPPIGPESERFLFAIELTSEEAVREAIDRAMRSDPDATEHSISGYTVWEILKEQKEVEVDELDIDGLGDFDTEEDFDESEEDQSAMLPNAAITVAHGNLLVSNHVDLIKDVLKPRATRASLSEDAEFKQMSVVLRSLGAGDDSFRFFTRIDQVCRVSYELLRVGKMPESQSMLGKVLNQLLGPEDEEMLREQQVNGETMPEFQWVQKYLGLSGAFIRSDEQGWFISGCVVAREKLKESK